RPVARGYRGKLTNHLFGKSVSDGLNTLCQREGVTLFMTLLAAWQLLLARYSGSEDIVVGTPIAGRTRGETESLIGFFINTLVLRTNLSGNPTFRELLRRVREVALGAYAYQDVPFEKLVEELHPERDMSHNPLFQVMFALQNNPNDAVTMPGLSISLAPVDTNNAIFDLTLMLQENTRGLSALLQYNTDLYAEGTISRMLGHFETLLEGIVSNPDQPLSELPMLLNDERRQLLVEWNDTARDYPRELCLQELFDLQAERTPNHIAVTYGTQQLTYRQLQQRANQLAHHLRSHGVGPDTRVGLLMERSTEMVVAMLGILKAGGAYVPLDVQYPPERLRYMVEDAGLNLIVTMGVHAGIVEGLAAVIRLDDEAEALLRQSEASFESGATAENLAYVIYTSGSTGRPKGIGVPHRAVNRLVCNTDYVQLNDTDRVAQAANASFDATTFEVWGALLNGAQIIGITRDVMLMPEEFADELQKQAVTAMFLTTSLFNELARKVPGCFKTLRHVMFGGEAVDARRVREVLDAGPPQRLLHVYGPTESTTFATWHEVRNLDADAHTVPIGKPIANT
ncbi:MAG: AMP-binding protein, partial [Pyrinomonadaceae bacterium]